jgi:hypothetical protein
MAITERYVTSGAGGGGSGTSGSPWTFAEAITNAVAGDRINVQSDAAYSIGATTFGAGVFNSPIIWRGYDSTIGDCDNLGRNSDGTLNTTGMPQITVTGAWVPAAYVTLQSLNITAALGSAIINSTGVDFVTVISCRIENTESNAAARAILVDDQCAVISSDLVCSGATSSYAYSSDALVRLIGCRFEIASSTNCVEINGNPTIIGCVFIKNGSLGGSAILIDSAINGAPPLIAACTFYNFTDAIKSTAVHTASFLVLVNNHCTDCGQYVNNTTNITCYNIRSRTRDNTSPPATVELITVAGITTDTGGASTDYANAGTGDFHLITAAPGYNAGWDGCDIGGLQTDPPSGGGGGAIILGGVSQTGIGAF